MSAEPAGQGQPASVDVRSASDRPLAGCRVLVTRPAEQAQGLKAAIEARGGAAVVFPLIRIVPPADARAARAVLSAVGGFDLIIFVSRNAVAQGLAILQSLVTDDRPSLIPSSVRVLAVGAGTAADLTAQGVAAVTVPGRRYDSEALLALDELGSACIGRARVLIVKGEGGRDLLQRTLSERGAHVETVAVYARKPPAAGEPEFGELWGKRGIDAIVLTSVEAAQNLFALTSSAPADADPHGLPHRLNEAAYAVVSDRVRAALASFAPRAQAVVAAGANDDALADAVVELMALRPSSGG